MTEQSDSGDQRKFQPSSATWLRWTFAALAGGIVGTVTGVVAGGVCSAIYGQPFVGVTGWRGFLGGLVFPGLMMISLVTAPIGAVAGVAALLLKQHLKNRHRGF